MVIKKLELSYEQYGIFFGCLNGHSREYIISDVVILKNIDRDIIKQAFDYIVKEQEMLRANIFEENGHPYVGIHDYIEIPLEQVDMTGASDEEILNAINRYVDNEIELFGSQLTFLCEFIASPEKSYYVAKMHHIISDGISIGILLNELQRHYNAIIENREIELKIDDGYSIYVEKQKKKEGSKSYLKSKEKWSEHLKDAQPLPFIFNSNTQKNGISKEKKFFVSGELVKQIKQLTLDHEVTEYSFYLAAFFVLMNKYTHTNDLLICIPFSNRDSKKTENTIGSFASNRPLRLLVENNEPFSKIIRDSFNEILFAYRYFGYPNYLIANENFDEVNRNNIWDISFIYNVFQLKEPGWDSAFIHTGEVNFFGKMDFSLGCDFEGNYFIEILYSEDSFSSQDVDYIGTHYLSILAQTSSNIEVELQDIDIISYEENNTLTKIFNNTACPYPKEKTVVDLLEEKAAEIPEKTAVKFDGTNVSFTELNARANRLGNELRSRGIGTNDFVLLIAERSNQMLEAIYGILKSGGAYVPVDPHTPDERIKFMAQDCSAKAIVTFGASVNFETDIDIIRYEDIADSNVSAENPERITGAKDLAYIIYTSGTTGLPKGVMIEHQGLVNLLSSYDKIYGMTENDVVLQFASYCFDQSVWDIFSIVWNGNAVCAIPADYVRNPEKLAQYMKAEGITLTSLTPAYINILDPKDFSGLRLLDSSGEAGNLETLRKWCKAGKRVINTYGPTEVTVNTSSFEVFEDSVNLPIGKLIDNLQAYIIKDGKLCGVGIPGELCIAGDGVARGYLNRPELTAEKFVENPFGNGKMYRSGDLARWLPDGNIEYLGRIDEQVKIRGFRIELGEIETKIRAIDTVKDCAVIARADKSGDKAIYAYYTSDSEISIKEIRDKLAETLPNYMIPAYMMQIESIPVTRNGKLDKRALPDIEAKAANDYVPPRNEAEKIVCKIFSEILSIEQVGIHDGFFELGGHSLRATRLVNAIEEQTGVKIALKDVFTHSTPEELAAMVESREGEIYEAIPKAEEKEYYPMSSTQKRTYLIQQLEPESNAYNMPFSMKMTGEVFPDKLKNALQSMLDRHEILRTAFLTVDGEPVQKILDHVEAEFEYVSSDEPDTKLLDEYFRAFDLSCPPLVRVKLVNKGDYHLFMLDMHHIVSDGMSENIFVGELTALYNGQQLPPLTHQFKDYSEWMRSRDLTSQENYWKEQFSDEAPALDMPTDFQRPQVQSYEGAVVKSVTDEEVSRGIKAIEEKTGATDYMIFLAALMVTLSKYSRQDDIVIGSPISGRTHRDTEQMMGMFVNTLAMRGYPKGEKTFAEFLKEIKDICLNAYENQEYPFEELVEAVKVRRDLSRNPLFDVMLTMQNTEERTIDLFGDVDLETSETENITVAKFDLSFDIVMSDSNYAVYLEYCTALFKSGSAERIIAHLIEVLREAAANIDVKLCDICMITEDEKQIIESKFNDTAADYPKDKTVVDLLEEKAAAVPERTAVKFDGTNVTFAELNARANRLGNSLRNRGIGTNDFVLLIAERSNLMLEAIYGILKSGGAYVPVDPNTPDERIKFMAQDCAAKAIVTCGTSINFETDIDIIRYEDIAEINISSENPERITGTKDLAYIIYTSGTTGLPKGVMIEHQGLVNLLSSYEKIYGMTEDDVVLQFASYCFDQSVWDIFSIVWNGNAVCAIPADYVRNPEKLAQYMKAEGITLTSLTPAYINILDPKDFSGLRLLDSSGEAGNLETLRKWRKAGKRVINTYGPTEVTVNTSSYEVFETSEKLPIGTPIDNLQTYITDGEKLCGIGVPGELCIAGDGVARGYLNRPELTEEKFVDNPFGKGRMYRSGDLARWLPDGNIEYLGRIDEQVKIRGFRIELGEIETKIRAIENIKDCAVIARADSAGDKAIYAYYTSDSEVSISEIREKLSETLPNYMIPAYMMQIESIPVTRNGKLDRRALPEIEAKASNDYVPPRSEAEKIVCEIFSEILGIEQVGIHDGFFELGGHSLRATRLINAIEERTGVKIALKDVFVHSTPEELAAMAESREGERYEAIPKAEEKEYYPMSSTQKRTYLIWQLEPDSTAYNMPYSMKMTGDVYPDKLKDALQKMLDRHEILRTAFLTVDGEPVQKILDRVEAEFEYTASDEPDKALTDEFFRPFDLSCPPLVRMKIVNRGSYHLFLLDMHHIVSDGMSEKIFVDELTALYSGRELEPLTAQYKDYSEWMRERDLSSQEKYWKEQFADTAPVLDMPLDFKRPQIQSYDGLTVSAVIDERVSENIRKLSEKTGATEYMIFLASLMVMLSKYSRQDDIVIGSPISGRIHRDTENMLGMFVNTLGLRGYPEGGKTFEEFLSEIKTTCLNAYENQEYPFEELVEAVEVRRDMSRNPLFDVLMVMQNNEETQANIDSVKIDDISGDDTAVSKFDMTYSINPIGKKHEISLEFCTALFREETAGRMLKSFEEILKNAAADSTQKISEIEMITDSDKEKILGAFNDTDADYPKDKTIADLFEEQAERTPNNIAVVFENETLTYSELNAKADAVAAKLAEKGLKSGDYAAMYIERSLEMIIGIYGIIKAGGIYVPINTMYPGDRVEYILNDCGAKILLCGNTPLEIEYSGIRLNLKEDEAYSAAEAFQKPEITPESGLYVIYTSGTTGKPKGVEIMHKNVVRLLFNDKFEYEFGQEDVWTMFHSYGFDFSVWEMYGATLYGGKLIVVSEETTKDEAALLKLLEDEKVTVLNQVPTSFYNLMAADKGADLSVRYLIFGGEALSPSRLKNWKQMHPDVKIVNMYGITETTVHVTYREIGDAEIERGISDIGTSIPTLKTYIMNGDVLCGIGVPGEMCVAGEGVARGYLNRPELNEQKFVKNPFGEGRMYRSGDLARWLSDGNIEYLGRIDEQVKIRGFRVELGEIESKIRELENIKDCAVITRTDSAGDKAIYAYFTSERQVSISDIRESLSTSLPNYMVPSYMMQIESIPVTRNGKLDRKALPEIEAKASNEYAAPRTEAEKIVCGIFSEVLNVEKVGIHDGFFELGGHSLRATRLVNAIEEQTGVKIALKDVFVNTTPEELAAIVESRTGEIYKAIPKAEIKEYYPMSSTQKRTYLIQQLEPESTAYNMPFSMRMTGEVCPEKLKDALQSMLDRHEILRTAFLTVDGEPVQKILDRVEAEFEYITSGEADEKLVGEYYKPFDLSCPPFVRVKLVNKGSYHLFLMDTHHIISDGMSQNIFISELTALYKGEELEPLTVQYRDYSEWMRTRDISAQANYWKNQFADEAPILDMPTDFVRPQVQSYKGAAVSLRTNEQLTESIKAAVQRTGATDYMLLLAALMVTLAKYSRQDDIVIGSPISGRTHRDTEKMLGMFVNTLGLRGYPSGEKTFEEFLNEIKKICLDAYENQEYPFEDLVEAVNVRRDLSRNPLFDVLLALQNNEQEKVELDLGLFDDVEKAQDNAVVDLAFNIRYDGSSFQMDLEYCTELFEKESAENILSHYAEILKSVTENINIKINDIAAVSEDEKDRILNVFNDTYSDYQRDKTVVDLIEQQAAEIPDNIALVFEEQSLTYAELNDKANALAKRLLDEGLKSGGRAAICVERNIMLPVIMLAVLKTGAAYSPIDSTMPIERIRVMLGDISPLCILTADGKGFEEFDFKNIAANDESIYECKSGNVGIKTEPSSPAYIMYTSGTTGTPKGIIIPHRALMADVNNFVRTYNVTRDTIALQQGSYMFDLFVEEVYPALCAGARIVILSKERLLNVPEAHKYILDNHVNLVHMTPMLLSEFNEYSWNDSVRVFLIGGEKVQPKHIAPLLNLNCDIYQCYGPTENTVITTLYHIKKADEVLTPDSEWDIPIGVPKKNTQVYILDGTKLCGIGVPGELCIAGDSLALGYLNLPELTAERFVDNPFGEGKMYRSGDLAAWLPDGNVKFLGRIDEQVKIRGIRIELGEIEAKIREIKGIKDCAVTARVDGKGEKAAYAYYISDDEISVSSIREELGNVLPDYMIPAYMMQIDEFPLNRSGKLDKRALPDIKAEAAGEYAAPETETQKAICEIFGEVLGVERVGINDSFFELGGHSLRATRLINSIEEKTGVKIPLKDVFIYTTPEQLAEVVDERSGEVYEEIPYAEEKEFYAVSSAQRRTYYFQKMEPDSTAYNMPIVLTLEGEVYPEKLKAALEAMVARHEILRTAFEEQNGEPVQKILDYAPVEFEYITSDKSDEELTEEYLRPFDLSRPPFLRMRLVNKGEYHLMVLDIHHIISDGMSETVFVDELTALYQGAELKPLKHQFKDYSEWINARDLSGQANYWKQQFEEEAPVLDMPFDYMRPQIQSFRGASKTAAIDESIVLKMKTAVRQTGTTEYMLFLAALMVTLSKYSRQDDIVIGSPISGRTHRDTERMLGMFINTLAMRGYPKGEKTFAQFLGEIKDICLNGYQNQEYPFEELVESVNVRRDMSRNPLFDVMMVLQNNENANLNNLDNGLMKGVEFSGNVAKFDLTFNIQPGDGEYSLTLEYCTDLFKEDTIDRIISHFKKVVNDVCENLDSRIDDIEMLTDSEKEQIIGEFNNTYSEYPDNKTIVEVFEEQVLKTPDNTAVVFEDSRLTYSQLNAKANALAYKLRELGAAPDDYIALIADRSAEMLCGIYGIIKSGSAYVPIDPTYPEDRISYMLKDCKPKAIVMFTKAEIALPEEIPVIDLSDVLSGEAAFENPSHVNKAGDLAYCIYTSGTTGKPKGVMVEHHGVVNLGSYMRTKLNVTANDRVMLFANYIFDGSVWEIQMALMNGAGLYIPDDETIRDISKMEKYIEKNGITISYFPPAYYEQGAFALDNYVITAGSQVGRSTLAKAVAVSNYINSYGPTETTVCATNLVIDKGSTVPEMITIGKPMSNVNVYIMDKDKLCGVGVPGELCAAGAGIARGYLNKPELTAEKFVKNPFGSGTMYRTGDLARWLPNGNIEYMGRIDDQVKIRGFRVELGEIESLIREIGGIKDCAVIAKEDNTGDKAIYAYFTSDEEISASEIKSVLSETLPNYMIPAYMMQIESIPVTKNGKLDKRALPDISFDRTSEYIAAESDKQKILCEVISSVLNVEEYGIRDDFFEFGGDSIKAIKVVSLLREKGYEIAARDIMQYHTVENLESSLTSIKGEPSYEQGEVYGDVDNTPVIDQFLSWGLKQPNYFNQSMHLAIDSSVTDDMLKRILTEIVIHHDMLRAVMKDGKVRILPVSQSKLFELYTIDLSGADNPYELLERKCAEIQSSMNLEEGPLVKALSFEVEKQRYAAVFVHHLVIDGVSWRIIQEDFAAIASQLEKGEQVKLPHKTASYIDWSNALKEFEQSGEFEQIESYWSGISESLRQYVLSDGADGDNDRIDSITAAFDEEETELIKKSVTAFNCGLLDIFLSAFAAAVEESIGFDRVSILIEDNGRREIHKEILTDRTVGWFTNTYPVIVGTYDDWESTVIENKEALRAVPFDGMGFMSFNKNAIDTKRFVLFNYLGEFESGNDGKDSEKISLGASTSESDRQLIENDMVFNGAIAGGKLSFDISYKTGKFTDSLMTELCTAFRENLLELAEYCNNYGSTMYTASDFSDDLDSEDYDSILDLL